jgi:hypothetical protein
MRSDRGGESVFHHTVLPSHEEAMSIETIDTTQMTMEGNRICFAGMGLSPSATDS